MLVKNYCKIMVIQGDFFRLTQVNEHSLSYDLELLYKIKGKNPREEFKNVAYGVSLETGIKKCIQYALSQKFETLSLKEYLEEYKKAQKAIEAQLQGDPIQLPKK